MPGNSPRSPVMVPFAGVPDNAPATASDAGSSDCRAGLTGWFLTVPTPVIVHPRVDCAPALCGQDSHQKSAVWPASSVANVVRLCCPEVANREIRLINYA